jgi:SsrA-binding protein
MASWQEKDGGELWILNAHIWTWLTKPVILVTQTPCVRVNFCCISARSRQVIYWIREQSHTAIPVKLYLSRGRAKIEIGLAKGKKLYDKRQALRSVTVTVKCIALAKGQYD